MQEIQTHDHHTHEVHREHHESLLERHWYVLVILFGLLFVLCIDSFRPVQ